MLLTGIRGVDDVDSKLDAVKYAPPFLNHLMNLADEVIDCSCLILSVNMNT